MACTNPKILKNKRFVATKKNGYTIKQAADARMEYVTIPCGKCEGCRKQKARWWTIRLLEELKRTAGAFVTLTFDEATRTNFFAECETYEQEKEAIAKPIRLFLERYRKEHGKSLRHWLVTERGDQTNRIHLHGIIFDEKGDALGKHWRYGFTHRGTECGAKAVRYIVKYVTKPGSEGRIFASPGIGGNWHDPKAKKRHSYKFKSGRISDIPKYYRDKIYTQEERDELWIEKMNEGIIYIGREKITTSTQEGALLFEQAAAYIRKKERAQQPAKQILGNREQKKNEKK